ncbi:MAG: biopolymer transporter ExbD [Pirellulaceae bacterium]
MRVKKSNSGVLEGDLTPMIDMTFQLIAFFMVLINFEQSEQHEKIQLPDSELAKPAAEKTEYPIILHLTQREEGQPETVILGGEEINIEALGPFLGREKQMYLGQGAKESEITVVIRAHKGARTGKVQNLIAKCQESSLENFKLRAKEDVGNF